jgi:hypothetical protein
MNFKTDKVKPSTPNEHQDGGGVDMRTKELAAWKG